MPPIINSEELGRVTTSTKEVFVECSGWHERTLEKTIAIVVTTLAEMGGKIQQIKIQGSYEKITPDLSTETKKLDIEEANSLLGLKIKPHEVEKMLRKMQYEYSKGKVTIPSWRSDILHAIDIK
jgi:phenylalanyl-tRNA synthetase beta subunit